MEVLFLEPYQLGGGPKEGLRHDEMIKHCSCPIDPKFKIYFFSPVKGAQNQNLGQKPYIRVSGFLSIPLAT